MLVASKAPWRVQTYKIPSCWYFTSWDSQPGMGYREIYSSNGCSGWMWKVQRLFWSGYFRWSLKMWIASIISLTLWMIKVEAVGRI